MNFFLWEEKLYISDKIYGMATEGIHHGQTTKNYIMHPYNLTFVIAIIFYY